MSQDFESPEPNPEAPVTKSGPKLKIPVPPNLPDHDPEQGSPLRRLSTMVGLNMLMLLSTLALLGYAIFLQSQQPPATEKPGPEAAKSGAASADEIEQLKAEIKGLTKKLEERAASPESTVQIKSLDDKIADLGKTVSEMPSRFDTISQKLEAVSKNDDQATAPKVDAIERRIGEISQSIDTIKADLASKPALTTTTPSTPIPAAVASVDAQTMDQAVDLFKKGKFAEAKDAFTRLQAVLPDDARVWYFSALANGLATRDWKGESERLVTTGMAKEKSGSPDRAKIDATFSDLTTNTGKDWLTYYRSRAAQ